MRGKEIYQGKNSEVIQQQNRLLVLRLIRKSKVTSRVMLAEATGLKQATITNIIKELMAQDYIKEAGLITGNNGRRVKGITLNGEKMRILVARINSDYYAIGMYDLDGNCIKVEKRFWENEKKFLEKMEKLKNELLVYKAEVGSEKQILGVGIVLQGTSTGIEPEFQRKLSDDLETFIESYLEEYMDLPIFVDNMSNMGAYFEWNRRKAEEAEIHTLVCLMVGYSVDCAIVFDGKIVQGRNGRAGHYGHVSIDMNGPECECGNRGCIKNYISVGAVRKQVTKLKRQYPNSNICEDSNIREIIQAFYEGDSLAEKLYGEMAEKLGLIVTNLINQLNPNEVILGDEIPNNEKFLQMIRDAVQRRLPRNRFDRVDIRVFKEERRTELDIGMRGMCFYIINERLKNMKLK